MPAEWRIYNCFRTRKFRIILNFRKRRDFVSLEPESVDSEFFELAVKRRETDIKQTRGFFSVLAGLI